MDYWFWIMVCSIPSISICFGSSILILCQNDFCRNNVSHKHINLKPSRVFPMSYNIAACKLPKQVRRGKRHKNSDLHQIIHIYRSSPKIENTSWPNECWFSLQVAVTLGIQTLRTNHQKWKWIQWSYIAAATMKPLFVWYSCYSTHNKNQLNYTKLTSPWQWTGPRLFPILHFSCPLSPQPTGCSHTFALDAQSHHRIHPFSNLCNPSMKSMRIYIYIVNVFCMEKCRQP